jgi:3,4-dihydroxy-2-butanone 4-phosphate synthase
MLDDEMVEALSKEKARQYAERNGLALLECDDVIQRFS